MQVRILCATALGNHVVLQPCYYCNKSQFMIMTQEEIIDTYASGTRCATFMHIQHGHLSLFHTLLIRDFQSDICDYVRRCKSEADDETQMTFPNKSKMTLVCECKCEQGLIQFQRVVVATDGEYLRLQDFTDTCSGTCLRCLRFALMIPKYKQAVV